jgi:hypothetical protein
MNIDPKAAVIAGGDSRSCRSAEITAAVPDMHIPTIIAAIVTQGSAAVVTRNIANPDNTNSPASVGSRPIDRESRSDTMPPAIIATPMAAYEALAWPGCQCPLSRNAATKKVRQVTIPRLNDAKPTTVHAQRLSGRHRTVSFTLSREVSTRGSQRSPASRVPTASTVSIPHAIRQSPIMLRSAGMALPAAMPTP